MKGFTLSSSATAVLRASCASVLVLSLTIPSVQAWQWGESTDNTTYQSLKSQAQTARTQLIAKINQAKQQGINTEYAEVSREVLDLFIRYAEFDRQNPQIIKDKVDSIWWNQYIPENYHTNIPFEELKDSVTVAEAAIAQLQQQMQGSITLQDPVDFTAGPVKLSGDTFTINDKPVYPSSFNWLPNEDEYIDAFGRIGGDYYSISELQESGELKTWALNDAVASLQAQNQKHISPKVFFLGYAASAWQKALEPEAFSTGRLFVPFDIDNTRIRGWYQELIKRYIPATKSAAGDGPHIHLLANEPHFATREGGWLADNGVSKDTKLAYQQWLEHHYDSIADLNTTYGTQYRDFAAARDGLQVPVATSLQGGPIWYDWCQFNMARVTGWFNFLKQNVKQQDPEAKVTIKLLGWIMSSQWRDHGIDIEALAKLQDVLGSDFSMAPRDLVNFANKEFEWRDRYMIDWVEQSRGLDFYRSIAPGKPFYDSEWHGLSANWQHFDMEPEYVRAGLWLGHTHGMKMNKAWVWGRKADSNPKDVNSIFVSEPTTQPIMLDAYGRTMKELNAHAQSFKDLVTHDPKFRIFYSKDSAIQDKNYVEHMTAVYEAMKMLNVDVGFTTANEMSKLGSEHVIIVPPTPYLTYWKYKGLQDHSAKKILVDSSASFVKNQHGKQRNQPQMSSYADIAYGDVFNMAEQLASSVEALASQRRVDYSILDMQNQPAYGVFVRETTDSAGDTTLSIINVSKDKRKLSLDLNNKVKDLVTGNLRSADFVLEPYDVYLVKTSKAVDAGNDIAEIKVLDNISTGRNYSVAVNYSATGKQNLKLQLISRSTWQTVAQVEKFVYAANEQDTWFDFSVPADIPAGAYEFRAMLIPEGQTWREAHDIVNQRVTVTAGQAEAGVPSGWTNLEIRHSSKCFDVAGGKTENGSTYHQWDCNTSNVNQRFKFIERGEGWYSIQSQRSDKCVDLSFGSSDDGAKIHQWDCNAGNQNQQWKLEDKGNGYFELRAKKSNKCLDVAGKSTANAAAIVQWSCYDGDNQQFKFK